MNAFGMHLRSAAARFHVGLPAWLHRTGSPGPFRRGPWMIAGASLLLPVLLRLLPASLLQPADALLGRPGDALQLLTLLSAAGGMLALLLPQLRSSGGHAQAEEAGHAPHADAAAVLERHLAFDEQMQSKLGEVIGDTESSALAIMQRVRQLHDNARRLMDYLNGSNLQANSLGQEIIASIDHLRYIGEFIQKLPERAARDAQGIRAVSDEIKSLSELVEMVQGIAMQSHLLAINAAIEASRAGEAGRAFRVVADEVRSLAANSHAAAGQISDRLGRVRQALESGMASNLAETDQQAAEITQASESIEKLQNNFEDMSQYYKTRFGVITSYNQHMTDDIAEVMGQIQYQDVVRQCIERVQSGMNRRNALLQRVCAGGNTAPAAAAMLAVGLEEALQAYLEEESHHMHSARHEEESGELKIELF